MILRLFTSRQVRLETNNNFFSFLFHFDENEDMKNEKGMKDRNLTIQRNLKMKNVKMEMKNK